MSNLQKIQFAGYSLFSLTYIMRWYKFVIYIKVSFVFGVCRFYVSFVEESKSFTIEKRNQLSY